MVEIKITGIDLDAVTEPILDGSPGSALYIIPFNLSEEPPMEWEEYLAHAWDNPETFTTMHRPGISSVIGKQIILDGTTIEEVEKYHFIVLKAAVVMANNKYGEMMKREKMLSEKRNENSNEHRKNVEEIANRLDFK